MSAADKIEAARALIEPLTGHTEGPWWTDGEYSEDECGIAVIAARTDAGPLPGNPTRGMVAWASQLLPENAGICEADARLCAAAPALRDTVAALADLAEAQAQEIVRLRGCFEQIEEAALNGCLTPDLVARITRAALGDAP